MSVSSEPVTTALAPASPADAGTYPTPGACEAPGLSSRYTPKARAAKVARDAYFASVRAGHEGLDPEDMEALPTKESQDRTRALGEAFDRAYEVWQEEAAPLHDAAYTAIEVWIKYGVGE